MNIDKFLYLAEAPMKSEVLGTSFERVVFQELLPYVPGVTSIIKVGSGSPISVKGHAKTISLIKPKDNFLATMRTKEGAYDLNRLSKLSEGHPDFIIQPLAGKNFLGYDSSKDIYVEAKTSATGRYRFGQQTYGGENTANRLNLVKDSQIYKYLTWFGNRGIVDWNPKKVVDEFNAQKAAMLSLFKVYSGINHRLIFALNEGGGVGFYAVDDTIDLLSGSFILSERDVLRYVFEKTPLFILEKVDRVGAVRVYSKVDTIKAKGKKLELVKEEAITPRRRNVSEKFLMTFKAETALHQVNNPNTKAIKPNQTTISKGRRVVIEAVVPGGKGRITLAAGTEYNFYEYLAEFRKEIKCLD